MPGMLTRIKVIYPVWLAIKWLVIVTIVSRSGGCGGNHGGAMQKPSLSDSTIANTGQFGIAMTSTDCAVFVKPNTLARIT